MFDDPIFFLSQYFECKQADIEWYWIFAFIVNVANDMWNLGFTYINEPYILFFIYFLFHIASSCKITSV